MNNKVLGIVIGVIVVALGSLLIFNRPKPPAAAIANSLASLSTAKAPWPVEYQHLNARLAAIHMQLLGAEGTAQHIHAHLDIYILGNKVTVPQDIGIPPSGGITPVHTHDQSGIIHIESPSATAQYTLGQFFDIWGVKLTSQSIGGYADNATNKLVVYDNGNPVSNPASLVLKIHNEIAIVYGVPGSIKSIPFSYSFPAGL